MDSVSMTVDVCVEGGLQCEVCTTPHGCTLCPDRFLLTHFTADSDKEEEPSHCHTPCADDHCLLCTLPEAGSEDEFCLLCEPGFIASIGSAACTESQAGSGWLLLPAVVSEEGREALLDFTERITLAVLSSGAYSEEDVPLLRLIQDAIQQTVDNNGNVGLLPAVTELELTPDYFSSPLSVVDGLGEVLAALAANPEFEAILAGRDAAAVAEREVARIWNDWNNVARVFPSRAADAQLSGATVYTDEIGFRLVVQGQNRLAAGSNAGLLYNPTLGPAARTFFESFGRAARLAGATAAVTTQQQQEVVEGQNAVISEALTPPWGGAVRRRLQQSTEQAALPDDILTDGYASQGPRRLAVAAQQNGGTIPYDHQSLLHINGGQKRLMAQAENQAEAAGTDPRLSPEVREQLRDDAQAMRSDAIANGGSRGVYDNSEQAALAEAIDLLVDVLASMQNNIIASVGNSDLDKVVVVAVQRWARENSGDTAFTLQELSEHLTGLNNLALLSDVKWYEGQTNGNIDQMTWSFHLGRNARRGGASASFTPHMVCDSLVGLQTLQERYSNSVQGSSVLFAQLISNVSTVNNPIKPAINAPLSWQDRGSDVQTLQSLLLWLGFYAGAPDGYYDELTHEAVAAAMADLGSSEAYVYNGTVDGRVWGLLWAHWFSACGPLLDELAGDVILDAYRGNAVALRRQHPNATISFYALSGNAAARPFDAFDNGTWYDFVEAIEALDCTEYMQEGKDNATESAAAVPQATPGDVVNTVVGRGGQGRQQDGSIAHNTDPRTILTFPYLGAFQHIMSTSPGGPCADSNAQRAVELVLDGTFLAASGNETGLLPAASFSNFTASFDNYTASFGFALALLEASKLSGINAAYLAVRARFEPTVVDEDMLPGPLAIGYPCPGDADSDCFNFYGLMARNESEIGMCPDELASVEAQAALAEEQGWFNEADAIIGGALWMAENWNLEVAPTHYH